jgi:hypothetical protein
MSKQQSLHRLHLILGVESPFTKTASFTPRLTSEQLSEMRANSMRANEEAQQRSQEAMQTVYRNFQPSYAPLPLPRRDWTVTSPRRGSRQWKDEQAYRQAQYENQQAVQRAISRGYDPFARLDPQVQQTDAGRTVQIDPRFIPRDKLGDPAYTTGRAGLVPKGYAQVQAGKNFDQSWQQEVMKKFPAIGREHSPENLEFVRLVKATEGKPFNYMNLAQQAVESAKQLNFPDINLQGKPLPYKESPNLRLAGITPAGPRNTMEFRASEIDPTASPGIMPHKMPATPTPYDKKLSEYTA